MGPRLLAREAEPPEHLGHACGVVGSAEPPFEPAAEIGPRPGAAPVLGRIGAAQDHRCKLRLLLRREPPRRPPLRPVAEPGEPLGVAAQHRVAQRLAPHAGEPRRLGSAQPVERVRDRVHPRRRPPVLLLARRPPNAVGRQLSPDLQRRSHGPPPRLWENGITRRSSTEPPESSHGLAGIRQMEQHREARRALHERGLTPGCPADPIRFPSQRPGTARQATSAGCWPIVISGAVQTRSRPIVRPRPRTLLRSVRSRTPTCGAHAATAERTPEPGTASRSPPLPASRLTDRACERNGVLSYRFRLISSGRCELATNGSRPGL